VRADRRGAVPAIVIVLGLAAGCAWEQAGESASPTSAGSGADATPAARPVEASADASLAGTSWQLVKITSMDDTTYAPSDPLRYTLEFGTDGSVRLRTDCNSGTGSWSSESAGQLRFGIIAATRAQCPPGSLDDRYLGQFQWVRSYVMEDGRLFLATMADGSIIEFEPVTGAP